MAAGDTVWTVMHHHSYGTDIVVYSSEESAVKGLAEICRTWWVEQTSKFDDAGDPPDDDERLIDAYFAMAADESYELEETVVE